MNRTGNARCWLVWGGCCLFFFQWASAVPVQSDDWFRSEEGRQAVENALSWQSDRGDWPKNKSATKEAFSGDRSKLKGTFDNGATTTEPRLLARAFRATKDARCEAAFLKGLRHVLDAQYPSGGWPQYHPPPSKSCHRHITFNDGTMVRILELLPDVAEAAEFEFVAKELEERCGGARDVRRAGARGATGWRAPCARSVGPAAAGPTERAVGTFHPEINQIVPV